MKLAAVAGPLGALKDARNKLQAALSRIGRQAANGKRPRRLFYVRVRRRVHFKL